MGLFRGAFVAAVAAGVVDQLAFAVLPFRAEGFGESGVGLVRKPVQRPPQPDMEEIHQVGIGDGVVIGRVGDDGVELAGRGRFDGGAPQRLRFRRVRRRVLQVFKDAGDPFDSLANAAIGGALGRAIPQLMT